ncbi:MAG: helix-turn-helix domain-containing protein [candidate division WOR-3 bacterium]|nr:helix-turn-helix domain-containing protein [candidate division WOR-3 bacterium]
MFVFTKEMAEKLKKVRKESGLSQKEVGIRMGLKMDSAQAYIARLERGEIKNPSLKTILDYLSVCNYAWSKFFSELSAIQFNLSHNEIMRKVEIPRYYQKIDRDVAKYTHSIQTKFSQKQNIKPLTLQKQEKMATEFLKYRTVIEQIEQEVTKLMGNTEEPGLVNQFYKSFARECYRTLKTHGLSPKSEAKLRARFLIWQNRGLKRELLEKVKEIAIKYLEHI